MARFYLYLKGRGEILPVESNIEASGPEAARAAAIQAARETMAHEMLSGVLHLEETIVVHDFEGKEVLRVAFRDAIAFSDVR
jgi:hypothetical protein